MKELNKSQALTIDRKGNGFYYEEEDDAYSVYGSDTGFCYLYGATKEIAISLSNMLTKGDKG